MNTSSWAGVSSLHPSHKRVHTAVVVSKFLLSTEDESHFGRHLHVLILGKGLWQERANGQWFSSA